MASSEQPLLNTDGEGRATEPEKKGLSSWVYVVLALLIFAVGILFKGEVHEGVTALLQIIKGLGIWAAVIICLLCWGTTAVCGPSFIWEMGSGPIFVPMYDPDFTTATLVSVASCTVGVYLGCLTAFALGRTLFREKAKRAMEEHASFKVVNAIISEDPMFAFIIRLNPMIPFEAVNLICALTDMSWQANAIATIGTMPIVVFEVYTACSGARLLAHAASGGEKESVWPTIIKLAVGGVIMLILIFYAKRKYDVKVEELAKANDEELANPAKELRSESPMNSTVKFHRATSSLGNTIVVPARNSIKGM